MNQYGERALRFWEQERPKALEALEDAETFFANQGEEIASRVFDLSMEMESKQRAELDGMDFLTRAGRLNAIRASAEEVAMHEAVYSLSTEVTLGEMTREQLEAKAAELGGVLVGYRLAPADPNHPWRLMHQERAENPGEVTQLDINSAEWDLDRWIREDEARDLLSNDLEDLRDAMEARG